MEKRENDPKTSYLRASKAKDIKAERALGLQEPRRYTKWSLGLEAVLAQITTVFC